MNVIERTFAYLMDGSNWQGSGGILVRLLEHLSVTALATACAALIVVPLASGLDTTDPPTALTAAAATCS